mgnify:CR=1 FL=1
MTDLEWNIDDDFASIAEQGSPFIEKLKNSHIFLTGGTGLIGTWLLEAIAFASV